MALDFHIGNDLAQSFAPPVLQLFPDEHEAIFDALGSSVAGPQLAAMRDYYADADYSGEALQQLIHELQRIAALPSASPLARDVATRVRTAAEQAFSAHQTLYAVAD